MTKLFYAGNTCSLASHIALEEAGAEIRDGAGQLRRE